MTIQQRILAPTPPFFKKLRNIGITLLAIGTSIMSAHVALPAILVKIASYLALAGTVTATVSQAATGNETLPGTNDDHGQ